jgi:O-antigen ligase
MSEPGRAGTGGEGTARRVWTPELVLLAAYLFTMPIQIEVGDYRQIAPADAFIACYLAVRSTRLRHMSGAWTVWHTALVPLLGLGCLVAVVRTGELTSYALLQKYVGLIALLATGACFIDYMRDVERLRRILRLFVGAVLLHATLALGARLLNLAGGPVLPLMNDPWPTDRISGLVLDANAFGGLVALALVLHHVTAGTPSALLSGRWAVAGYAVLPATLLLTFSRSSWIGLTCGLAALLLVRPALGGRTLVRGALPVVVLVPLVLLQVPDAAALVTRPSEISSRLVIGFEALHDYVESPVFGIGLGVYVAEYRIVVHNTALWFLSDLGLIGLAVFLALVVSVAVRLFSALPVASGELRPMVLALLCGHVVMAGVSLGIEAFYQRHWWLVFAAAGVATVLALRSSDARAAPRSATEVLVR